MLVRSLREFFRGPRILAGIHLKYFESSELTPYLHGAKEDGYHQLGLDSSEGRRFYEAVLAPVESKTKSSLVRRVLSNY